jgi:hypothetical protein
MPGWTAIWKVSASMGDLGGLASVRQADLDPLAADHDRPADGYPPPDLQGLGQSWRLGSSGACSAQPGAGLLGDGAGNGADEGAAGQDVDDRAVQAHGDPPPGQR